MGVNARSAQSQATWVPPNRHSHHAVQVRTVSHNARGFQGFCSGFVPLLAQVTRSPHNLLLTPLFCRPSLEDISITGADPGLGRMGRPPGSDCDCACRPKWAGSRGGGVQSWHSRVAPFVTETSTKPHHIRFILRKQPLQLIRARTVRMEGGRTALLLVVVHASNLKGSNSKEKI